MQDHSAEATQEPEKAEVFTDRKAFLIASHRDNRQAFQSGEYFVLARTEHQALLAIARRTTRKLKRNELEAMMLEELTRSNSDEQDNSGNSNEGAGEGG